MKPQWVCLWVVLGWQSFGIGQESASLHRLQPRTPQELQTLLSFTGTRPPLVSAHRGGAGPGLPENCLATFQATLQSTFAMLEIDPRLTRDGVVVVHHDATLERTTTGTGVLAQHNWDQLQQLRLKDSLGQVTEHTIPTLEEVINWARGRTVLVLDQKDVSLQTRVDIVTKQAAENFVLLIVGKIADIQTCHRLNPNLMMEVFISDQEKFEQFDRAGVPWRNIIAFVGHTPPQNPELLRKIHAKGALCMAGTSRNIDQRVMQHPQGDIAPFAADYLRLLQMGIDIIETDIPRQVGPLLSQRKLSDHSSGERK